MIIGIIKSNVDNVLLYKEEIKEKMKILVITKVFKTIKNASAFITRHKEKTRQ